MRQRHVFRSSPRDQVKMQEQHLRTRLRETRADLEKEKQYSGKVRKEREDFRRELNALKASAARSEELAKQVERSEAELLDTKRAGSLFGSLFLSHAGCLKHTPLQKDLKQQIL